MELRVSMNGSKPTKYVEDVKTGALRMTCDTPYMAEAVVRVWNARPSIRLALTHFIHGSEIQIGGYQPNATLIQNLAIVCRRQGYGSMLKTVAWLWRQEDPETCLLVGPTSKIALRDLGNGQRAMALIKEDEALIIPGR